MSNNSKVEGFIDSLRNRILSGEFGNDGRLPSFRSLATEYKTTQETMNKTMQALQAEGLLTSMGAKGVFVNNPQLRFSGLLTDFYNHLKGAPKQLLDEYIEQPEIMKASLEVAEILQVPAQAEVIRRFKKQGTNQIVIRIEEIFYPKSLLTDEAVNGILDKASFSPIPHISKKINTTEFTINEKVLTRLPSTFEQTTLKIVRTNPVIDIKRTLLSKDKKHVIAYSHLVLNANHFVLSYEFNAPLEQ